MYSKRKPIKDPIIGRRTIFAEKGSINIIDRRNNIRRARSAGPLMPAAGRIAFTAYPAVRRARDIPVQRILPKFCHKI